jgi:hypothetical protein
MPSPFASTKVGPVVVGAPGAGAGEGVLCADATLANTASTAAAINAVLMMTSWSRGGSTRRYPPDRNGRTSHLAEGQM